MSGRLWYFLPLTSRSSLHSQRRSLFILINFLPQERSPTLLLSYRMGNISEQKGIYNDIRTFFFRLWWWNISVIFPLCLSVSSFMTFLFYTIFLIIFIIIQIVSISIRPCLSHFLTSSFFTLKVFSAKNKHRSLMIRLEQKRIPYPISNLFFRLC